MTNQSKPGSSKRRIGVRYFRFAPLLTRATFRCIMACFWLYSACWIGGVALLYYFSSAHWYEKMLPAVLLVLGTPAAEDLFMKYSKYKEIWEASNDQKAPNQ